MEGRYAKKKVYNIYLLTVHNRRNTRFGKIEQLKEQMEEIGQGRDRGREATKGRSQAGEGEKQLEHVAKLISNDRSELRCTMQIAERGNQGTTQQRLITRL